MTMMNWNFRLFLCAICISWSVDIRSVVETVSSLSSHTINFRFSVIYCLCAPEGEEKQLLFCFQVLYPSLPPFVIIHLFLSTFNWFSCFLLVSKGGKTTGRPFQRSFRWVSVSIMTYQWTSLWSTRKPSRSCTICGCVSNSWPIP